jgi:hypothetical protein
MQKILAQSVLLLGFAITSYKAHADTIGHYINITSNITQMELKADSESQSWARGARNVITLTCESILESLNIANKISSETGKPMYCMPPNTTITSMALDNMIQDTYRNISSQAKDKDQMSVSQVALLGLQKTYPCKS